MSAKILISGAGQLGSRYLQGLNSCKIPLQIFVQDCYEGSLTQAKQRWTDVLSDDTPHRVSFGTDFQGMPDVIDVAIIATTANVRANVVAEISEKINVKNWILEKVLTQSETSLDELVSCIGSKSSAWVNTPRRMMLWHKNIKDQFDSFSPISFKVEGGMWGLACNAIHYLDLLSWWTGETLVSVNTENLNHEWFESKRKGYWEVTGSLEAAFSNGSTASLKALNEEVPVNLLVHNGINEWVIDEVRGVAVNTSGVEISGRVNYQSEMSAELVESILERNICELPSLEDSTSLHRVFIRAMQAHWNKQTDQYSDYLPIT